MGEDKIARYCRGHLARTHILAFLIKSRDGKALDQV
jgi:hypothetical protein